MKKKSTITRQLYLTSWLCFENISTEEVPLMCLYSQKA